MFVIYHAVYLYHVSLIFIELHRVYMFSVLLGKVYHNM